MDDILTDDVLLQELQRLSDALEHPPCKREISRYGEFSDSVYQSRFGSLAEARNAAGISEQTVPFPTSPVDQGSPQQRDPPSHNDLLKDLYLILSSVGRRPNDTEIQQFGIFELEDFVAQFGSLRAAIERVEEGLSGEVYTLDGLCEHLRTLRDSLGRPPLATDVLRSGTIPLRKYGAYFQSWESALDRADIPSGGYSATSKDALLEGYVDLWDRLGRPPLPEEVTEYTPYSKLTYIRRFGNWGSLLRAANRTSDISANNYQNSTKLLLALDLRRVSEQTGGNHTIQAVNTHSPHSIETYQSEFTRWETAVEAAGLTPQQEMSGLRAVSIDDVRKTFETITETTPVPSFETVLDEEIIDPYALFNKFGSWKLTTTIAGVPYRQPQNQDKYLFPSDAAGLTFEDQLRIDEGLGSDTVLLDDLDRVTDETGSIPRPLDVEILGAYSPQTYLLRFGSWEDVVNCSTSDADDWSAMRPTQRKDIFGSLLLTLERCAVQTGQNPTETTIDTWTDRTSTSYIAAFGEFNTAVDCAGVRTDEPTEYARDVLTADLYRLEQEFGARPPEEVLSHLLAYETEVITDRFGSMRKAWTAARNAGPEHISKSYGPEEVEKYRARLLSEVPNLEDVSGELTPYHLAQKTPFSPETYISMFGNVENVIAAVNDNSKSETECNGRASTVSSEMRTEISSALWDIASESGSPIQIIPDLYENTGKISISTIEEQYEDFTTAANMAGLETENRTDIPTMWYPPLGIDLVKELERVSDVVGGKPTVDEMNAEGQTSVSTYVLRFGSWEAACDSALSSDNSGVNTATNNTTTERSPTRTDTVYSRARLLHAIKLLADDLGELPTEDDMNQYGTMSIASIYDRFGSWENALIEAELIPAESSINLHTPTEELDRYIAGLSIRSITELEDAGYETVEDLRQATKSELTSVPQVGPVTAEKLLQYTK
ncbi:helix-hairpin-helix domain-containing protein [Halorubrum laminariae]|uniref:Helix-hairpin-helix domain-containing protein n=1 Tax=Halorubrum laminariae TaxID=1433523 RepID=A0ABD6C3N0_9EURY|nr:helix-hairpin-helix domain-containing protein [Halorubrum laminariae]